MLNDLKQNNLRIIKDDGASRCAPLHPYTPIPLLSLALFIFIITNLSPNTAYSQPKKDALEASRYGFDLEQQGKLPEALFEYNKAITSDPKYPYPVSRIGAMYQRLRNYPRAINFLKRAVTLDSSYDDYNYYNLGTCYKAMHKLDSALIFYEIFLNRMNPIVKEDSIAMHDAEFLRDYTAKSIELQKRPKNTTDPVKLTSDINSGYDDYAPSITADGEVLYFTSHRPSTNIQQYYETKDFGDDIFVSKRDDKGNWTPSIAMPSPINSKDDEGVVGISPDGQTVYYSLCRRPDGFGDCDIYQSTLSGTDWSKPKNLGRSINSAAWDSHPSISPDGNAMYFSSRRAGSIDSSEDIWVAYRNGDGTWGPPVNLGPTINTEGSERSPFIAADGVTLYFSSNGHPGFGAHDLFMTRKQPDGGWSDPINLGSPINGADDDEYLTMAPGAKTVFYASRRGNANTGFDIYEAVLPPELMPFPVTLVKGLVVDKSSRKSLGAKIEVADLDKDEPYGSYQSNSATGKFFFPITKGRTYGITASVPHYTFYSQHYTVPDSSKYTEVNYTIELSQVPDSTGLVAENEDDSDNNNGNNNNGNNNNGNNNNNNGHLNNNGNGNGNFGDGNALNNIFFDFNKATLRKESIPELKNLVRFLAENPKIKIEISGHTDSIGTAEYNQTLSQERANAVREYLIGHGVKAKHVSAKGYGATRPIAPNDTEENRQRNRRTEFHITNRKS
ncbi:MAG TPA: OmpA family protein [Candidatus Kapabacteria bacterium]|nr:OmpA family protein [Candidatus Kapabacteria bacterium]